MTHGKPIMLTNYGHLPDWVIFTLRVFNYVVQMLCFKTSMD